jgi:hypothetical protein
VSFFRIPSPRGGAERAKKDRTVGQHRHGQRNHVATHNQTRHDEHRGSDGVCRRTRQQKVADPPRDESSQVSLPIHVMRTQYILGRNGALWIPSGSQALGTGVNPVSEISNPMHE